MLPIKIDDNVDIHDIVARPDAYPEEILGAAFDTLKKMNSELYSMQKTIELNLITRMHRDQATKMVFKSGDKTKCATLLKGKMECKIKTADFIYKQAGFDPLSIGEYEFKPKWSLAKEMRKLGGKQQKIIDEIFIEGNPTLKVEDC